MTRLLEFEILFQEHAKIGLLWVNVAVVGCMLSPDEVSHINRSRCFERLFSQPRTMNFGTHGTSPHWSLGTSIMAELFLNGSLHDFESLHLLRIRHHHF